MQYTQNNDKKREWLVFVIGIGLKSKVIIVRAFFYSDFVSHMCTVYFEYKLSICCSWVVLVRQKVMNQENIPFFHI